MAKISDAKFEADVRAEVEQLYSPQTMDGHLHYQVAVLRIPASHCLTSQTFKNAGGVTSRVRWSRSHVSNFAEEGTRWYFGSQVHWCFCDASDQCGSHMGRWTLQSNPLNCMTLELLERH